MANAEEPPFLQFEPLKAAKKRCKGVTRNGTAWAMEACQVLIALQFLKECIVWGCWEPERQLRLNCQLRFGF